MSENKKRPVWVMVISILLLLEALVLVLVASTIFLSILETVRDFSGLLAERTIFLSGWFLLLAVFLMVLGHYFFRGSRWTRSPVLVWQLLMLAVSFSGVRLGNWVLVMVLCATVILLLLFTKPVTQFLSL